VASGFAASVGGGIGNTASGDYSNVVGGEMNDAQGYGATIAGGNNNVAHGGDSSVSGGFMNKAFGDFATVGGGSNRSAPAFADWAAGALFQDQ
jgi:hypothetical protein